MVLPKALKPQLDSGRRDLKFERSRYSSADLEWSCCRSKWTRHECRSDRLWARASASFVSNEQRSCRARSTRETFSYDSLSPSSPFRSICPVHLVKASAIFVLEYKFRVLFQRRAYRARQPCSGHNLSTLIVEIFICALALCSLNTDDNDWHPWSGLNLSRKIGKSWKSSYATCWLFPNKDDIHWQMLPYVTYCFLEFICFVHQLIFIAHFLIIFPIKSVFDRLFRVKFGIDRDKWNMGIDMQKNLTSV